MQSFRLIDCDDYYDYFAEACFVSYSPDGVRDTVASNLDASVAIASGLLLDSLDSPRLASVSPVATDSSVFACTFSVRMSFVG
ncbi:MAG: hypothetical protein HQM09_19330 [Candidatus Riflebacteria bacterium]|nr:hypothetical protein [Candidatus Riflebacteria bacterium]